MSQEFISTKRVVLSSPGSRINNLYYNQQNTSIEDVEVHYATGRYKVGLNNTTFASSALVTIPNSSFLGTTYLSLELPATVANQTLARGWGYMSIESISYLFGSSNVSQLRISGKSVLQTILMQAETAEKRNEIFRLSGEEILTPGVIPTCTLILPFPWSTFCGLVQKKEFDTNILSNPITLRIQFHSQNHIYGGDGARPSGFSRADLLVRQGDLDNKSLSLRNALLQNPSSQLGFPFIHHQTFDTPFNTVAPNELARVVLQSFLNADLTCITMMAIKNSDVTPVGNNSPSGFNGQDMRNIVLRFNGEVMYDCPQDMAKVTNMHSIPGAGYFHNSVIQAGTVAPFNSIPVDTYVYTLDFSRIRSLCFESQYQNTLRIAQQTLTLEFNVADAASYTLFCCYHYNGIVEVSQGMSNIFFN